jgi:hypothetical protein
MVETEVPLADQEAAIAHVADEYRRCLRDEILEDGSHLVLEISTLDDSEEETHWYWDAVLAVQAKKDAGEDLDDDALVVWRLSPAGMADSLTRLVRQIRANPIRQMRVSAGVGRAARMCSRPRERSARSSSARSGAKASSSSDDGPEPPPLGRACRGCGGPLDGYHTNRQWCNNQDCQDLRNRQNVAAHRTRLAQLDALLEESARMGVVERIHGVWRLTAQADRKFGAALRALPGAVRDEVRAVAA